MNKKQKMIKKTAKRAKARLNKHTDPAPTIKKYVSKKDRARLQAKLEAEAAIAAKGSDAATAETSDIEDPQSPAEQTS